MKFRKLLLSFAVAGGFLGMLAIQQNTVLAAEPEPTILKGVLIGELDLSGKTAEEAKVEVEAFIEGERNKDLTFLIGEHEVNTKAGELGVAWTNLEVVEEAALILYNSTRSVRI